MPPLCALPLHSNVITLAIVIEGNTRTQAVHQPVRRRGRPGRQCGSKRLRAVNDSLATPAAAEPALERTPRAPPPRRSSPAAGSARRGLLPGPASPVEHRARPGKRTARITVKESVEHWSHSSLRRIKSPHSFPPSANPHEPCGYSSNRSCSVAPSYERAGAAAKPLRPVARISTIDAALQHNPAGRDGLYSAIGRCSPKPRTLPSRAQTGTPCVSPTLR